MSKIREVTVFTEGEAVQISTSLRIFPGCLPNYDCQELVHGNTCNATLDKLIMGVTAESQ